MTYWTGFSRTAVAAAVAIVAAAPAFAQNTTAALGGRVVGADGKPVAGATITILHVQSGSTNTATSDAEGRYGVRGLRVGGPYTITVTKGGLVDKREDVFLALAETTNLDAMLGNSAATVVVTGRSASDKFNKAAMGSGTAISSRELGTFASIQRNLQDYARNDPRLAQTDKERGEISAGGQNTRFNSITIDGVAINDTFGLESNNLPTAKQPISIDAIQSVQVNLSNYDVTQKGYTGANINAVTKSGTNEFKGTVSYVMRDDNMVGKRYNRTAGTYSIAPPFKEDTQGFTIGGPILKDKLFFFAAYEKLESSRTSPDFGPVGSPLTNVGITSSAISDAISTASSTWGMNVGTSTVPQGVKLSVKDTLLKLDWNISDNHRANIRYTKTDQTEPFLVGFGTTSLSLSSYWYNQKKEIETVVGQWFADWTPSFSTELKISKRDYDSRPTQVNGTKLPMVTLAFTGNLPPEAVGVATGTRNLLMGTELSRQFNILKTTTDDIYAHANWNLGDHELKGGLDYSNNDVYNAFLQNVNGNYTFRCEDGVTYATPLVTSAGAAATCATATAATVQAAVLENFRLGRPSSYTVQLPRAGRTLDDGVAEWSFANKGLFLQDTWNVSKNLTLTLGVRVDQQSVPTKPIRNTDAGAAPVVGSISGTAIGSTVVRASGGFGIDNTVTLDGQNLVQPRVGFNWNPGLPYRSQLRGGFGLFQGAAANVWLSNPFSNTGAATAQFNCASYTACRTAGVTFNANPSTQPVVAGNPPAAAVDALSPDLKQPSVWKANLGFEIETPPLPGVGALVVGAEWLHTKTNQGIYYQHLNLGKATSLGSDGRDLFWNPEGYSTNCWTAGGATVTTGACATPAGQSRTRSLSNPNFANVIMARGTKMGGGDAITLSLSKPVSQGFGWAIAYTRTTATEVSPLTSSTSNSNWNGRNIFNPNEETLQNSNYLTRDRFNGNIQWSKAFVGNYRTTFGVTYEGRKGKPYSWTYINDMNGDGIGGNDLMYIPKGPGSGEVIFRGADGSIGTAAAATAEANFWRIVDANPALRDAKGGVVGRNNSYGTWVNNFDVRISQELPGFLKDHKAVFTMDILNFGNLLKKQWGRIDEIGFPSNRSFVNYTGVSGGKYVYSVGSLEDYVTRQAAGESQWAVQFTLRYEF